MSLLPGKLPPALLAELLEGVRTDDPRVLVGPGIGRDAAVIDLGDRVLVAKTDPVTFATEQAGWYAVNVNANDIACMGARPTWFLATALLPPRSDEVLVRSLFAQVRDACGALGVSLVGGHTEVTLGLDRPIICGAMLGEAQRDDIVKGEGIRPGDAILLTKGIAIEGTALLAREAGPELERRGIERGLVERARTLLFAPGISVVRDAAALRSVTRPRLMHDPTEGGIATALQEMAQSAGAALRVRPEAIRVLEETRTVCEALGLDPMGLLGSGALLAIVDGREAESCCAAVEAEGIPCAVIGTVEHGAAEAIIGAGTLAARLPGFERDELARYFDTPAGLTGRAQHTTGRDNSE